MTRSPLAQQIFEESMGRAEASRRRFIDDMERRAVYDDPGPSPEADSRAAFEDQVDRYDPDDVFDLPDGLCPGRDGVL